MKAGYTVVSIYEFGLKDLRLKATQTSTATMLAIYTDTLLFSSAYTSLSTLVTKVVPHKNKLHCRNNLRELVQWLA